VLTVMFPLSLREVPPRAFDEECHQRRLVMLLERGAYVMC